MAAALADRDQLVAFAAMVLSCDPAVSEARMGHDAPGGGISHITATGAAKATGMPIATATRALLGLESAGPARCNSEGNASVLRCGQTRRRTGVRWRTEAPV